MEPMPCDWCEDGGAPSVEYRVGCVFVECRACGKRGPVCPSNSEEGGVYRAISAWNRRATDPLREALLWFWAAQWHLFNLEMSFPITDDIPLTRKMLAAANREVIRLLGEQCPTS